jgi:hypothetical protein
MTILVTGASGFLGGALARALLAEGKTVRVFARKEMPELAALGAEVHRGDLADRGGRGRRRSREPNSCTTWAPRPACWGPFAEYHASNVLGTGNVLASMKRHGVRRLVYTSSPSVVHAGSDIRGADESLPYATHFETAYPETKAKAERLVLAMNSPELLHRGAPAAPDLGPRRQSTRAAARRSRAGRSPHVPGRRERAHRLHLHRHRRRGPPARGGSPRARGGLRGPRVFHLPGRAHADHGAGERPHRRRRGPAARDQDRARVARRSRRRRHGDPLACRGRQERAAADALRRARRWPRTTTSISPPPAATSPSAPA